MYKKNHWQISSLHELLFISIQHILHLLGIAIVGASHNNCRKKTQSTENVYPKVSQSLEVSSHLTILRHNASHGECCGYLHTSLFGCA